MTIPKELWDQHKAEIYDRYFHRNDTIEEVIRIMKRKGLDAT